MPSDPVSRFRARAFSDHSRDWGDNRYVYPVISRRSGGVSIGVNLNPDTVCNYGCVYCQVDRTGPRRPRGVDPSVLRAELDQMLGWVVDGSLYSHPQFAEVPAELRHLNDVAFSGDGEPTTCPVFAEAVTIAAELRRAHRLDSVKLVLITNACYLTRPNVVRGLETMYANGGEVWAKLDAGTEKHFQAVNRPNYSLDHVIRNITAAAGNAPLRIQSLWMRLHGVPPAEAEVRAFVNHLCGIVDGGGDILEVQLYTVARQPTEAFVAPLLDQELDAIADLVADATGLAVATYYGVTGGQNETDPRA